jgi:hypothetical protein
VNIATDSLAIAVFRFVPTFSGLPTPDFAPKQCLPAPIEMHISKTRKTHKKLRRSGAKADSREVLPADGRALTSTGMGRSRPRTQVSPSTVTRTGVGRYTVDLGVDSRNDGLLFVIGMNNDNILAQSGAFAGHVDGISFLSRQARCRLVQAMHVALSTRMEGLGRRTDKPVRHTTR